MNSFITLYNTCSTHDGYSIQPGVLSTLGQYLEYIRRYLENIGGCSAHWGGIMSTLEVFSTLKGYHEYSGGYDEHIRGCSLHWREIMIHVRGRS